LNPPVATAGSLFARYVAIGNSVTAGFQSGGINDSTQNLSYAVLLAVQMGTEFNVPLLGKPGCPPPFTNIFTQEQLGPPSPLGCAFRSDEVPEFLNLVAIPGAATIDVWSNFAPGSGPNSLTTVLGGGLTQIQNARRVMPTFVTVWIGNNDVLGAVTTSGNPGDPARVTSAADFASHYGAMMDSLDALGSIQGGVLIGAVQVSAAPYLTQGRAWKVFELGFDALFHATMDSIFRVQVAPVPLPFTANIFDVDAASCLINQVLPTGDTAWAAVPFPYGGTMLSTASARAEDPAVVTQIMTVGGQILAGVPTPDTLPTPTSLDCTDANGVTPTEMANLMVSVAGFNAVIEAEADERNWLFVDPNDLLLQLAADTSAIRPFPAFPGTAAPSASLETPFGSALSLDGIHPSTSAHRAVAAALIAAINAAYGTSIPGL
jgi:lysophospholipase L1-like esterase